MREETPLRILITCVALTAGCGGGDSGSPVDDGGASVRVDAGSDDPDAGAQPGDPDAGEPLEKFSFFVTSLDTMRAQSGSQDGFGGDLGGLAGADAICQNAAAAVGFGGKTWRAFLSVTQGPDGNPVNAIDRIGSGPWYDRNGRLIASDLDGLRHTRPDGDAQAVADLADERGVPLTTLGDSHDVMTGSNSQGQLASSSPESTCADWTTSSSSTTYAEKAYVGHSWPAMSGQSWMSAHRMRGCAPGVNLQQNGPGQGTCVGCSGGWGGIYCFALTP